MKIAVTGATGLIGSALAQELDRAGHSTLRIVRKSSVKPFGLSTTWDLTTGQVDLQLLENLDAIIHLAGENIAKGRWTASKMDRILDSRVNNTLKLVETLKQLKNPPRIMLCASAIGYYGDRGNELLTEQSLPGSGFVAEVCQQWEAAARSAETLGARVAHLRLGVVLSPVGGALAKMLLPFKCFLGGKIGTGRQYWSWIALADAVSAINHVLLTPTLAGPVNLVSPNPVTNAQFTALLGKTLARPAIVPMPAFAARLALGKMADDLLLASQNVRPARLTETGFSFKYPELEHALQALLGKTNST